MTSFKNTGAVMVLLVLLFSVALIGCDLLGGTPEVDDGDTPTPVEEETSEPVEVPPETEDSALTPYTAALAADVALDGSLSGPDGGFASYTEQQLIQLVFPPAMYSFGNTYFAFTDVLEGSAQMESRSISGLFRLNVDDESMAIVNNEDDIIEVMMDHLDLELSGSLSSLTDFLDALMGQLSGTEPGEIDRRVLLDLVWGGRVGLSTYISFTDSSYPSLEEPVDTVSSLYIDVSLDDFLVPTPEYESDVPEISGELSAMAYFSVASNLLIEDGEYSNTYYRIPSVVTFEMKDFLNSAANITEAIEQGGSEFNITNPDDFIPMCQALWGVSDESGFFSLSVEIHTGDGLVQAEIEDFDVISLFATM
jgi:hypothetical protein